jgi:hydroxymethylpyrimidine/phosphomethylpyrimidine kinase
MAVPRVLVIAATDSSGGAGLTRDVQTLAAWQMEARCAVTAVTVQTDVQLRATHALPGPLVAAQIQAALADGTVRAIKIGMLAGAACVQAVSQNLPSRASMPIVLDPVLVSSSGGQLLDEEGQECLRRELLPQISLLTPNVPEAAALLGEPVAGNEPALLRQMHALIGLGASAVLVKGGHEARAAADVIIDRLLQADGQLLRFRAPRVPVQRRGTGCSLASAIAAQMAREVPLAQACAAAQAYLGDVLRGNPWQASAL